MGQRGSSITREIPLLIQPHNKSRPPETTLQPQRNSQQTQYSVFTALKKQHYHCWKGLRDVLNWWARLALAGPSQR